MLINTCFRMDGTRLSVYSQTFLISTKVQGSPNTDLLCFALIQYYRYNGYAALKRKIGEIQKNFLVGSGW